MVGTLGTSPSASKPDHDNEDGPMVEPLGDPEFFGTLTWPNRFDIDPEYLRQEMAAAGELMRVAGK
jgi:hypothetical protein